VPAILSSGGDGLQVPPIVVAGGTIEVDVATNDPSVEISDGASSSSHPVGPGKRVTIPVPPVPPGTVLAVVVGRGLRARVRLVEVIAP
jgi:hypothetical protein